MQLTIAAIRTGTDPQGPLPPGAFHRTLDTQITCPKCDATYNLVADYDQSTSRHFEESARKLLLMLSKAVFLGHANDHRISHFETSGTIVRAITPNPPPQPPQA